jgi:hypothetical protein
MRTFPAALAAFLVLLVSPARAQDGVRFADVQFRILTSGARQASQEAGAFQASIPLGTPGRIQREVTITNATRAASRKVLISLGLTPLQAEDGSLHCMVLSDALPEAGDLVSRAKDLVFSHPGEQLMELFADPVTGTHLVLAVQVTLLDQNTPSEVPRWPRLRFTVKVERWEGADRTLLDQIQLVSEDGLSVSHRYDRKVPRWVESAKAGAEDFISKLPVIDPKAGKTTIKADEGFSIMLPTAPKKPPSPQGENAQPPPDAPEAPPAPPPKDSDRSLVWVQEWMEVSISLIEMNQGALSYKIVASGEILDPDRNEPVALGRREATKSARPAEPTPLYLTREEAAGPRGYVLWVVPEW